MATTHLHGIDLRSIKRTPRETKSEIVWKPVEVSPFSSIGASKKPQFKVFNEKGRKSALMRPNRPFMEEFITHANATGEWAVLVQWGEDDNNLYLRIDAVSKGSPSSRAWDAASYKKGNGTPSLYGEAFAELIVGAGLTAGDIGTVEVLGRGSWLVSFPKGTA